MSESRGCNWIAVIGLGLGAVFGMLGSFVSDGLLRQIFWLIDGTGLVVACVLLAVQFFRKGNDFLAAGFLVFAIGESFLILGTGMGLQGGIPAFGSGVALWSAGLLLISIPHEFASWNRIVGILSAVLFAVTAFQIFMGEDLNAISRPLPFFAYPFVVLTFVGWISSLVKEK